MKANLIKPIDSEVFRKKIKTSESPEKIDFKTYFASQIEAAADFAIGPFYWFIPDNSGPRTVAASTSFEQLTPFTVKELISKSETPQFFADNIHETDRMYVLSAIEMAMKTSAQFNFEKKAIPKFNIYCRMLNAQHVFVWRLIQFPCIFFNDEGQPEGVFVMVTDLSHLPYINKPMMTMIDNANRQNQYFAVSVETQFLKPIDLPKITNREQQLLKLIVKGFTNPLIAKELKISTNTVQNHKRHLREKTNTHTAAELVAFVIEHNLV